MNIEETIKHCQEVAEELESYQNQEGNSAFYYKRCEFAAENRQLAEWLKELKELKVKYAYKQRENEELKRLLKLASIDAGNANCSTCKYCDTNCNNCLTCYSGGNWKWRYANDIEILLSEEI